MTRKVALSHFCKLGRRTFSSVSEDIIVSRRNDKAILQFNRPKKRNAMSNEMQIQFANCLREFESDSSVSAVIIKGNEVGFSAGGDVVQFVQMIQSEKAQFHDGSILLYRGLLRLAEYKKPVICLADKICMGGGAATAFLSSHPVVTERTIFAMPEVFIGFYPNVGANYFVAQLPNNFGMWIGLTGSKFIGSDIINLGLSKNYVKSTDLNRLEDAIVDLKKTDFDSVSHTIAQFQQKCNSDWHVDPKKVEQLFSGNSVEQIVENLEKDKTQFSAKILELFSTLSPTALKLTFNMFRESQLRQYSKNEALSADFTLFHSFYGESANINDFSEGIRSVLVDKKHKPNWIPNTLQQVDDKRLISYFTTNVVDIRANSP